MCANDAAVVEPSESGSAGVVPRYERILQPVDLADPMFTAIDYAKDFAERSGAVLYLLHVVPTDEPHLLRDVYEPWEGGGANIDFARQVAHRNLEKIAAERLDGPGRHRLLVAVGDPAEEIVRAAGTLSVDLIVLATHGRSGMRHLLLGSVAEKVVRRARCPVLTVRQPPA